MVYQSYYLKTLCLYAILSFIKTAYAFSIAPDAPNSLFVGGSVAVVFTSMDSQTMNMDIKLAVSSSNNVLEVIALLATNKVIANNYAGIVDIPGTIPEGSNYYFIAQVSGETGDSTYAESGPHNIPKSFSPNGANLSSVTAVTVLETYALDTPPPLAVAQTSAPSSSSTTNSVSPTPTPANSSANSSSSSATSKSASATPKSSGTSSQSGSTNEDNFGKQVVSLSKTIIIVIAVVVPVVVISIIAITVFCLVRHRRRRRMGTSSGTTPWGTRTTNFVTRDRTTEEIVRY